MRRMRWKEKLVELGLKKCKRMIASVAEFGERLREIDRRTTTSTEGRLRDRGIGASLAESVCSGRLCLL